MPIVQGQFTNDPLTLNWIGYQFSRLGRYLVREIIAQTQLIWIQGTQLVTISTYKSIKTILEVFRKIQIVVNRSFLSDLSKLCCVELRNVIQIDAPLEKNPNYLKACF